MVITLLFYLAFFYIEDITYSKKGGCYYGTYNIKVNRIILIVTKAKHLDINYCSLLRKSFKDDEALRKLISLKYYDGAFYDHAYVVSELYNYFGHNIFWEKAKNLNEEDRETVEQYLNYVDSENQQ